MKNRFLAIIFSLVILIALLPTTTLAETALDITTGNITITSSGYTQGDATEMPYIGAYTISGTSQNTITIAAGTTCDMTITGLNIAPTEKVPAISVEAGATLNLTVDGENQLVGGPGCAGIYVAPGATQEISGSGTLNAVGGDGYEAGNNPSNRVYAAGGAGIGGNGIRFNPYGDLLLKDSTASFGTITINNITITATGGRLKPGNTGAGAGIGSGGGSTKFKTAPAEKLTGTIIINGGNIQATGGHGDVVSSLTGGGAGIGAGGNQGGFYTQNNAITVVINSGEVTAQGQEDGAGIGGGANVDSGNITITGGTVIAIGGYEFEKGAQYGAYGGAGIGGGDNGAANQISITGGTVTATAIGAAAGIGGGNDSGMASFIPEYYDNYAWWGHTEYNGSISIGGNADVTAYGGSHVRGTNGGAGIGAGQSYYNDNGCGTIVISDTATVKAYAGANAQAIGVGSYYAGSDTNILTIADTVTLWAQTQDKTLPALLNSTISDTSTLNYNSTNKYLVFNTTETDKAVGYLKSPNSEGTDLTYSWSADKLTIDETEIATAAPVDSIGNWATLYGTPTPQECTVTYYVNGNITQTEIVAGGGLAQGFTPVWPEQEQDHFFVDWYSEPACQNKFDFATPITGDIDLYAKFIAFKIEIKVEVKINVDIIGTDIAVASIGDDQKHALAQNIDKSDVQSDTNLIEIDAIVKNADDQAEIAEITKYLSENKYKYSSNRIDYDVIVQKIIYPTPGTPQPLYDLKEPIKITFAIPQAWQRRGTVYMFRAHIENGSTKVEPLADLDTDAATYTIASDKFSTYTMIFVPTTGGGSHTTHDTADADAVPDTLNGSDHFAYIIGYPDGNVRPNGSITRAEAATVFFRLLTDEARAKNWRQTNDFTDVSAEMWCNNAISTLSHMGIISGDPEGTFRPNDPITRAELAKIAVGFFDNAGKVQSAQTYTDVAADKWYAKYVAAADQLKLVEGYPDGTFRPGNNITRAEACTMVNRILGRAPHANHLLAENTMLTWPDNPKNAWYYIQIQEATNSHDYRWIKVDGNNVGEWTAKLQERNWADLEKAWADAYDAPSRN